MLGKWLITGAGGLALLVIIFAAFEMVTSSGNPEKISTAKKQITGALLGVIIVMFAFQFIVVIITIFATPAEHESFDKKNQPTKISKEGNLSRFLGVAWWTICSEKDLRAQNGNTPNNKASTASCKL